MCGSVRRHVVRCRERPWLHCSHRVADRAEPRRDSRNDYPTPRNLMIDCGMAHMHYALGRSPPGAREMPTPHDPSWLFGLAQ